MISSIWNDIIYYMTVNLCNLFLIIFIYSCFFYLLLFFLKVIKKYKIIFYLIYINIWKLEFKFIFIINNYSYKNIMIKLNHNLN